MNGKEKGKISYKNERTQSKEEDRLSDINKK